MSCSVLACKGVLLTQELFTCRYSKITNIRPKARAPKAFQGLTACHAFGTSSPDSVTLVAPPKAVITMDVAQGQDSVNASRDGRAHNASGLPGRTQTDDAGLDLNSMKLYKLVR